MYILGLDCYGHDSAAALIKDGQLMAAIEEERLNREKHTSVFPLRAIKACLEIGGIKAQDLDYIGYYWNPYLGLANRFCHICRYFPTSLHLISSRTDKFGAMLKIKKLIKESLSLGSKTKILYLEHHPTHAASCFLVSPFEQAAILSIDAAGEWTTTWLGLGQGHQLKAIKKINFPHSLGILYGAVTAFLGFKFASGEGKVMGLAPYGRPSFINQFRKIVKLKPKGSFELDLSYFDFHRYGKKKWFSDKFFKTFGPARQPESELTQRDKDLAASLQLRLEEVALHLADYLYQQTKIKNLCLAGGVALNSVMNSRLFKESPFEEIFIQPAANDAGCSLGAAYYIYNVCLGQPRNFIFEKPSTGPEYSDEEIERVLVNQSISYKKCSDPAQEAAQLLAQQKIIGWFQGRLEFGPRALGNRSILADPRPAEMKDILNARVKHRESFRPFAPSILAEKCSQYFETDYPSPYMLLVYSIRPEKKKLIPAVVHIDGTGRVQTVEEKINPLYYQLIKNFEQLTGLPLILNTSFNVRGQPIVCSPQEALDCFQQTAMDALIIGNYIVSK